MLIIQAYLKDLYGRHTRPLEAQKSYASWKPYAKGTQGLIRQESHLRGTEALRGRHTCRSPLRGTEDLRDRHTRPYEAQKPCAAGTHVEALYETRKPCAAGTLNLPNVKWLASNGLRRCINIQAYLGGTISVSVSE